MHAVLSKEELSATEVKARLSNVKSDCQNMNAMSLFWLTPLVAMVKLFS